MNSRFSQRPRPRPDSSLSVEFQCYVEDLDEAFTPKDPPPLPTLTTHDSLDDVWTRAGRSGAFTDADWIARWSGEAHAVDELREDEPAFHARLHEYADAVEPYLGRMIEHLDMATEEDYRHLAYGYGIEAKSFIRKGCLYQATEVEPLLPDGTFDAFSSLDDFFVPGEVLLGRLDPSNLVFVVEIRRYRVIRAIIQPKRLGFTHPMVSDQYSTSRWAESF